MDGSPHTRPAVAAAGGRGGFCGLSGRRRAYNDAGVHHNIHPTVMAAAVTAVTHGRHFRRRESRHGRHRRSRERHSRRSRRRHSRHDRHRHSRQRRRT